MAAEPRAGTEPVRHATTAALSARGASTCHTTAAAWPEETAASSGGANAQPSAPSARTCGELVRTLNPRKPVRAESATPETTIALANEPRVEPVSPMKGARRIHRASTGAARPSPEGSQAWAAEWARSPKVHESRRSPPPVSSDPRMSMVASRPTAAATTTANTPHLRVEARHARRSWRTMGSGRLARVSASMRAHRRARRPTRTSRPLASNPAMTEAGTLRTCLSLALAASAFGSIPIIAPTADISCAAKAGSFVRSRASARIGPPRT